MISSKKKICVISSSRAEYGLLKNLIIEIKNWRLKKSEHLSKSRRPDLWEEYIAQKR